MIQPGRDIAANLGAHVDRHRLGRGTAEQPQQVEDTVAGEVVGHTPGNRVAGGVVGIERVGNDIACRADQPTRGGRDRGVEMITAAEQGQQ